MTIDHRYWKRDCECHCARQAEKEAFKSHSRKQGKASTSGSVMAFQSKANSSPAASSAKNPSFKHNLCLYCGAGDHKLDSCPKKQTTVSPKSRGTSATADTLAAASEKPSEK